MVGGWTLFYTTGNIPELQTEQQAFHFISLITRNSKKNFGTAEI